MSNINGRLHGTSILILEDNLLVGLELESALADAGAHARLCTSVTEALAVFDIHPLDFVLTDYWLDGEICGQVIEAAVARGVPYALLTGHVAAPEDFPDARIFDKPFNMQEIITYILANGPSAHVIASEE